MTDRVLPETIDFSSMLPLSIPAIAKRHKFYPSNGSTFSRLGNRTIRIELPSTNALLDPTHSYLEFEVLNNGAQTFGVDIGGSTVFFENVRVEQGGKVLSNTQQCARLHSAILSPSQMSSEGQATEGMKGSTRSYNTAAAGSDAVAAAGLLGDEYVLATHNSNGFHAAAQNMRYTMPITSGLFSQDKLIPLPLVNPNAPITLCLDLLTPADVGAWNGAPGADDLVVIQTSYIAHMIEVGRDVIDQFRGVQEMMGGQLAISGQDWEYTSDSLPAATTGQAILRCPVRKRSIKSIFWCAQSANYANTAGPVIQSAVFNLSFAGNANIDTWQLQMGSVVYPSQPINCWGVRGTAGAEYNRGECCMELAKALGTLGQSNPTGILNAINYGTDVVGMASGENGIGGVTHCPITDFKYMVCPFGVSTESWQRDLIESGVDTETLSQEINLLLNWAGAATSGAEVLIVHMWVLYDQHYYFNRDGSITFSN